jgi:hypothetical protein
MGVKDPGIEDWATPRAILDFRIKVADLKAQHPPGKECIHLNLQS